MEIGAQVIDKHVGIEQHLAGYRYGHGRLSLFKLPFNDFMAPRTCCSSTRRESARSMASCSDSTPKYRLAKSIFFWSSLRCLCLRAVVLIFILLLCTSNVPMLTMPRCRTQIRSPLSLSNAKMRFVFVLMTIQPFWFASAMREIEYRNVTPQDRSSRKQLPAECPIQTHF